MTKRTGRPASNDQANINLGVAIRKRRIELGKSQAQLATDIGISFQQIQKYEKGANRIPLSRLEAIARGLHIAPATLLGWTKDDKPPTAPDAERLLRQFGKITNPATRAKVIGLVKGIADTEMGR